LLQWLEDNGYPVVPLKDLLREKKEFLPKT
jgi:hypothetical protein